MKPTSWLVNASCGPIVDESALIEALRAKRLGGAAPEEFNVEPLPADRSFRTLENVVATPHLGYVSQQQYELFYGDSVRAIAAWLADAGVLVSDATSSARPTRPTGSARRSGLKADHARKLAGKFPPSGRTRAAEGIRTLDPELGKLAPSFGTSPRGSWH
jgi:D-isomer specific 2-hydroxyacid dehydrogenase, NAD binding domain